MIYGYSFHMSSPPITFGCYIGLHSRCVEQKPFCARDAYIAI